MAVVIKGKLIFLEHPRTASTSMRTALQKIGGKTKSRHTLFLPERNEMIACTVRNPFDVLVSWWLIIGARYGFKTFKDFVRRCDNDFMVKQGNLFYFAHHAHFILRFENLQNDLDRMLDRLRLARVQLPHLNGTSKKLSYHNYYDPETIKIVAERFRSELLAFHYSFETGL